MFKHTIRCVLFAAGTYLLAACSGAASGNGASAPGSTSGTAATAGNVCERKLLVVADVTGILSEPVVGTKPLKGDPGTCYFITATDQQGGPELGVTLRATSGRAAIKSWLDGRMGADAAPVSGVGESAVWVSALAELDAQKDDRLCVIALGGSALIQRRDGFQKKAGDLCNRILAAN
jgi:hypothetical protein